VIWAVVHAFAVSAGEIRDERVMEQPFLRLGRETCGDLPAATRREWLITNGLGGYAMGTLSGIPTRRYHGWLVAALAPPVERTVLVGGLDESIVAGERRMPLSSFEFVDGTIAPEGWRALESFELDGSLPVWHFAHGEILVERRAWMVHGANSTVVRYRLLRGPAVRIEVTPLVTCRDHHILRTGPGAVTHTSPTAGGIRVHFDRPDVALDLIADQGDIDANDGWWLGFRHAVEADRGLNDRSDLYAPATFHAELAPGISLELTLSAVTEGDAGRVRPEAATLEAEVERQRELLSRAGAAGAPAPVRQLVLAADQFLVERRLPGGEMVPSVIAGYPWFNDWGRDTFISLPGLALVTGRSGTAAAILRAFAGYVRDGLVPNNFPDAAGDPAYNTADASLWFVVAAAAYERATGDAELVHELFPVLTDIVDTHLRGTRHGIGVDTSDGLVRAGQPGYALTWLDARYDGRSITPRIGKPVEINALWYNALCIVAALSAREEDPGAEPLFALADQVARSFRRRFLLPGGGLRDVVDGPDGDEPHIRPNQILAVSLPFPLLTGQDAERVVEVVGRELLTSHGLRTLAAGDPEYRGAHTGDRAGRDEAYHQGTVWSWLIGPYVEAHLKVHGDRALAASFLQPFVDHLSDAGVGSISETFDGDAPFRPRGAPAQAWGVAELLRAWALVAPWRRGRRPGG
jgi:predicted glycogen debranching enzyme